MTDDIHNDNLFMSSIPIFDYFLAEYPYFPIHNFQKANGCSFKTGYVQGEEDKEVGFVESAEKCFDLIRRNEPAANGLTWESASLKCYAEFGAATIKPECNICQSCIFKS